MAEKKIITKKDGTKVVAPDDGLKKKLGKTSIEKVLSEEKVKSAEKIIERDGDNFSDDAMKDIKMAQRHFNTLRTAFDAGRRDVQALPEFTDLLDAVLNMKSQSGMYGFAFATAIARSLHGFFIERNWQTERGMRIINLHLDALSRVFSGNIRGDGGIIGKDIVDGLEEMVK